MELLPCNFAFCVFLLDAVISLVSAVPKNCTEFKVIPPDQYDRDASSANDITKRPLGFMFDIAHYPGVQTDVKNPCAYMKNLTSKAVLVMVQTRVQGKSVCVKDNSPQPKIICNLGSFSAGCWEATADAMTYEFYCDPSKGCDTDVQFWYRLTPSTEEDIDQWCLDQNTDEFPDTLVPAPYPATTPPTVKSHTTTHAPFCWSVVFGLLSCALKFLL